MDTYAAIKHMTKCIDAIEALKSENDEGADIYKEWQDETEAIVRNVFGKDSSEYIELHALLHPVYFCTPLGEAGKSTDNHGVYVKCLEGVYSKLSSYKTILAMKLDSNNTNEADSPIKKVIGICSRFSNVTRNIKQRHSNRTPLTIKDEYDVQYLLKILLSVFFDDIRAEEPSPSYAGSSSRIDFLLKNECIAIETKMTRKGLADKELSKQLIQDIAQYKTHSNVKMLVCFVFDPDRYIENPSGMSSDLEELGTDTFGIKVVISS